jgi:hypothetical protein
VNTTVEGAPRHDLQAPVIGALDATKITRFAGPGTFAHIPDQYRVGDYDIVILGVPFGGGASYRPGARAQHCHPDGQRPAEYASARHRQRAGSHIGLMFSAPHN